ncbi:MULTISPECIES: hypothetical protein [Thomasclavelia]|uniref:hypothetical protein n=1 Tax=Thomasclavelia TaxID=3025755 RepID=UPI000E51C90C|nr:MULTISPECIES: hypothetical protein [Thomasclavelia]MBV3127521.1 hypothetical protein [Thomasclavelia ramosa]MBV3131422.1 hypothetical protein [Thomasclavelia ramosa]MBV3139747.1 hypothetical protein [Thomasclavelia ramosa]MBV3144363.1 hypothetical protein [Thomasclavelia ramosa]MBV3151626.1 hypothetical protein [Thomasclavelia ramosa]
MAVSIPTKITVPPDLNMSDPGDIAKVWSEIQITIQYINKLIDVLNDHKETLGLAVYYEE